MKNKFNEIGDYYVNTFQHSDGGDGSALSPFKSIAQAITAVGTATGKKIVIAGGGLIQEDCSVINGAPRNGTNSKAIIFFFDGGYAKTDCLAATPFKITTADTVYNMSWINGSYTYLFATYVAGSLVLNRCILDSVVFPAMASPSSIKMTECILKQCLLTQPGSGYTMPVTLVNCVLDKTYSKGAGFKISAVSSYVSSMSNSSPIDVTSIADCCCKAGAVIDTTNFTIVDEPSFVDPVMLRYYSLEGCSLSGKGSPDPILNIRRNAGIPGLTRKTLSTDSLWSEASGAIYDGLEPDGNGGFRLMPGRYYGTAMSSVLVFNQYTLLNNVKMPISTTVSDNMPVIHADATRAEHEAYASATSVNTSEVILSMHASSVDDYYTGMFLNILYGSGTAGRYEIIAYDGATRTATLSSACGTTDETTRYYVESSVLARYDFKMRFCGRGEDITSMQFAAYESDSPLYYSVEAGVLSGNADAGYNYAARRQPVATQFQFIIAINSRSYGS